MSTTRFTLMQRILALFCNQPFWKLIRPRSASWQSRCQNRVSSNRNAGSAGILPAISAKRESILTRSQHLSHLRCSLQAGCCAPGISCSGVVQVVSVERLVTSHRSLSSVVVVSCLLKAEAGEVDTISIDRRRTICCWIAGQLAKFQFDQIHPRESS